MTQALTPLGIRNPKDVIISGLRQKIDAMGPLRVPFDITTDYPSRETYANVPVETINRRRIVVNQLANDVARYGIGHEGSSTFDFEGLKHQRVQGWVDNYVIEVSVWSTSSEDRDNVVELIKLWMLELEQNIASGDSRGEVPFFFDNNILAVRFVRAYEGVNKSLVRNGSVYIGTLVYHVIAPFLHDVTPEEYERYKLLIEQRVIDF